MADEQKQPWTASPSGRGTLNILWTCVSTLALCVWTAVHPNIAPRPGTRASYYQRSGMMLLAMVFPEVLLSSAWLQLYLARNLKSTLNGCVPKKTMAHVSPATEGMLDDEEARWSIEQGFFAVMGGYAVDGTVTDPTTFETKQQRRIVTALGLELLARAGALPALSNQDIKDRSKADLFAKTIVLLQIAWFGLQVISRLAAGLAVTPLEAHTAVHVCCAIGLYLIWLKKPYNVDTPIVLKGDNIQDLVAWFTFLEVHLLVHQYRYKEYEDAREVYWKDRHVRNANNILDHDPPPTHHLWSDQSR